MFSETRWDRLIAILKTKFLLLARNPGSFIIITIIIGAFAYVLGLGQQGQMPIAVYSSLEKQSTDRVMESLEQLSTYRFSLVDEQTAVQKVEDGDVEVAVSLFEDGFELFVSANFLDAPLLQNELNTIYSQLRQKEQILDKYPEEEREKVATIFNEATENPSFSINYSNLSNDQPFIWDSKLHSLFGFSLFMVIYTLAIGIYHIVTERRNLIWDRLTVASIKKSEVYIANLLYCFIVGYVQVAMILCIFRFVIGIDFYGGFWKTLILIIPYLLCMIAIMIFIASIANTPGKYNAFITLIAVPCAMLGGAYWPLEIVSSDMLLALSYISPIRYGMELLNGATLYGQSIVELLQPAGILLFMTILFMGLGINIMEKRSHV